jgi:hypothetical protein
MTQPELALSGQLNKTRYPECVNVDTGPRIEVQKVNARANAIGDLGKQGIRGAFFDKLCFPREAHPPFPPVSRPQQR